MNGGGTVTLSGIPYSTYDLYVYFTGFGGSPPNVLNYTIGGNTQTLTNSMGSPNNLTAFVQGMNYVKFSGLTGSGQTMTVAGVSGGAYGVAGLQVNDVGADVTNTITASVSGSGGTISPSGAVLVPQGLDQTFTITPTSGYWVSNVVVDGSSVGVLTSYTFANVSASHTISVSFVALPLQTIVSSAGTGGTIAPVGTNTFTAGATPTFTIVPNTGYALSSVLVDGASVGPVNSYTFAPLVAGHTIAASFTALSRNIPRSDQLLFAVASSNLPATGAWPCYVPASLSLTRMGSATSEVLGGIKWEKNVNATGDGFHFANYPQPTTLPFNGGTMVAAIKPARNGTSEPYACVVSVLLGQFELCVANDTGDISIGRGGVDGPNIDTGVTLPNGQAAIVSVVVQPTGEITLYLNGVQAWSTTSTYPFSPSLTAQTWYATDVNVGKGWNGDGWSSFNGDIGDVFVYEMALSGNDRQTLESDIAARFGIAVPVYAPISGTVTLTDGITPVAGATVTATGTPGVFATTTAAADGTYSLSVPTNASYTVSVAAAGYSAPASQNVNVGTSPVTGINFALSLFCGMAGDPTISLTVDPGVPLTNYWSGGEWNTGGNFEGWTTRQIGGATVAGGVLTGTASDGDPQLALTNFAGGPDLELAFYDYLDVRLQVPAGFTGNIPVCFGTTSAPGIDPLRVAVINHTNIPPDGAFHVYRLFFGPQVYWRGSLSDLRIDPLGCSAVAGQTFAIDSELLT